MAEAVVRATFVATDHVSPVIKGMRGEITKLGSKTGGPLGGLLGGIGRLNLSMVGLGIGVVGAVGALGDFAKSALDEQTVIARLTTSLKDNVPGWNGNTDAINAYIAKGEELAFSVDDQRNALAQLLPRTHDVAKAEGLLSLAMDASRLKGLDLVDTSMALGKVYSGNVQSAKRLGFVIDKNATSTQALAQIQKAAAGQADAYANTQAGALAKISIQFDEMEKTIGRGVLNVIDDLGNAFNNLQRAMDPTLATTQDMEAAIRKEAAAMGLNADAAVAFYEAQTKATELQKANAQATWDQAVAAEHLANPLETNNTLWEKFGGQMVDIIRVVNDGSGAIQQQADYTQSADGVVNQYAASIQKLSDAEAYHHRNDYLAADVKVSAEALRGYEGAWRGAAINIPAAVNTMSIATHKEFKGMLAQNKADLKQLIHDINHPGEDKKLLAWLPKAMTKAQNALHTAQVSGDAVAIGEAQTLVDKLNAEFQLLHGPTTVSVHIAGGGGRMATRASGGPVSRGSTYLVGENGPEVLHMGGGGGQITQGRGGMGGGSGSHTTLVYLNGDLIAKQVDDYQGRRWNSSGSGSRN